MCAVPVKHHTRSKVGRRRSQQSLKKNRIEACGACKGPVLLHRACPRCGEKYKKNKK